MKYASPAMIARHARKHRVTVIRALKAAKVPTEKAPGVRGLRIPIAAANKFLERQWPEVPPLS